MGNLLIYSARNFLHLAVGAATLPVVPRIEAIPIHVGSLIISTTLHTDRCYSCRTLEEVM
jgi:hypothetical protein